MRAAAPWPITPAGAALRRSRSPTPWRRDQSSSDLDYASTTALALNGGSIQDAAGNAATLTLPTTGADGLATQNIVIDTTAPTVAGVSSTQATGAYGAGTAIPITVTFSEPVTVTGTPQLTLNAGSGAVANYTGGSGTSTLTFTYTVAAGQNSSDLDYASTTALALNGGTIQDAAGNAATLTLPTTGTDGLATQNIVIDTTPPTVAGVSSTQATGSLRGGDGDPDHGDVQRSGHGDGDAAVDAECGQRRRGQLHRRERHFDAHLHLHRGGGR